MTCGARMSNKINQVERLPSSHDNVFGEKDNLIKTDIRVKTSCLEKCCRAERFSQRVETVCLGNTLKWNNLLHSRRQLV